MTNHIPNKLILGKDWGYENPQNFYTMNFFVFKKGIGGHANIPPELYCILSSNDQTDIFLKDLINLLNLYYDSKVVVSKNKNIKIEFFEWSLYDYDFQLVKEIEKLILEYQLNKTSQIVDHEFEIIYKTEPEIYKTGYNYIETKTNLSFTSISIDLNCYLIRTIENEFINQIKNVFNSSEFDELMFFRHLVGKNVQFQISFIKNRTFLSKKGKYSFDILLIDETLNFIIEKLGIKIGRINDDYIPYENREKILFTKNIS